MNKVSICIPCYNSASYLEETLNCLLNQSYQDLEIIIINDHSTDSSLEIIKRYAIKDPRICFEIADKKGAAAARNQAYKKSLGNYIVFFDADDWIPENFIETQLALLKSEEEVVVSAWGRFYENNLDTINENLDQLEKDLTFEEWVITYWINASHMTCPGRVLMHKSLVEKAGLWDEDLNLNDDFLFYTQVFANCSIIRFNNESLFYYRSGINGLSSYKGRQAYSSLYKSLEDGIAIAQLKLISNKILNKSYANLWQNFIYETYPYKKDLIEKAECFIQTLGGSDLRFPAGGKTRLLNYFLGWKLVKRIKLYFQIAPIKK